MKTEKVHITNGITKMKNTLLLLVFSLMVFSGLNLQAAESAKAANKKQDVVALENVAEEYKLDNFTNTESETQPITNNDEKSKKNISTNLDEDTKVVRSASSLDDHREMQKSNFGFSEIAILCIWGMTIGLSALYVKKIKKLT